MLRVSLSDKAVYNLESDVHVRINTCLDLDLGKPYSCDPRYYRKHKKEVHVGAGKWIDGENHENANILYACLKGLFWAVDNKEYSYNSAVIDISHFVDEPDMLSIVAETLCEELDDLSSSIKGLESREFCVIISTFNEYLDEKIRQLDYELKDASIATVPQAFGDLDDPITWDAVDIIENKCESFVEIFNEILYRYFGSDWEKKKKEITHFLKEEYGMAASEINKIISTGKRQKPRKDYIANIYFAILQILPEKHLKEWLDYDLSLKFFCAAGHNLEIEEFNAYCKCYQKTRCFGECLDELIQAKHINLKLYCPQTHVKNVPNRTDRYVARKIVTQHMLAFLHTTDNFSLDDARQLFDAAGYEFNESEFPKINPAMHVGKQLVTYLRKLNEKINSEALGRWITSKYIKDLRKQKVVAKDKVNRLGAKLKDLLRDVYNSEVAIFEPVEMLFYTAGYYITRKEIAVLDTKNYFGINLDLLLKNFGIADQDKALLCKYSKTSSNTLYDIRHDIIRPLKTKIHCIVLGINYIVKNDDGHYYYFDITDAEKIYQMAGYQLSEQESDTKFSQWELRDDALVRHCFEKGYNMIDVDHFLQNIWGYESGWGEKEKPNKGRRYDNEGIVEASKQALAEREI